MCCSGAWNHIPFLVLIKEICGFKKQLSVWITHYIRHNDVSFHISFFNFMFIFFKEDSGELLWIYPQGNFYRLASFTFPRKNIFLEFLQSLYNLNHLMTLIYKEILICIYLNWEVIKRLLGFTKTEKSALTLL